MGTRVCGGCWVSGPGRGWWRGGIAARGLVACGFAGAQVVGRWLSAGMLVCASTAAVDAAGDGDTTFVRSGTNDENVENRKRAQVHEDQEG